MNYISIIWEYIKVNVRDFKGLALLMTFFAAGAAVFEILSIAAIIPLLLSDDPAKNVGQGMNFNFFGTFFVDMSMSEKVQFAALMLVVLGLCRSSFMYLFGANNAKITVAILIKYRRMCADQILAVSMKTVNTLNAATVFSCGMEYSKTASGLMSQLAGVLQKLFTVGLLLTMLMALSWKLSVTSLVFIGLSSVLLKFIARWARRSGKASNIEYKNLSERFMEALSGIKPIKAFGRENVVHKQIDDKIHDHARSALSNNKAIISVLPTFELFFYLTLAAIFYVSSVVITDFENWIMVVFLFMGILLRLVSPAVSIYNTIVNIVSALPAYEQLLDFLNKEDKHYLTDGDKNFDGLKSSIAFKDVCFHYDAAEEQVITDMAFDVPRGKKIGIVGRSGAGKSTLIDLLMGFYHPTSGEIQVDGEDLRSFKSATWRSHIGLVSQDAFIFNDTVRNNIGFPMDNPTDAQIKEAARLAFADKFIEELPEGYETQLGERGVRLSGGQRQRISIARAILKQPEILIFDEATSALDTEAEGIIQEAIDELGKGRTIIAITHRLSTIKGFDEIVVIDKGQIIEKGTHAELLANRKTYADLYSRIEGGDKA